MVAVSSFATTIQNLASMTVATEWDKDGKAIKYEKLKDDDFIKAADTVANAFCSFLTTLHKSISEDMADDLNGVVKDLTKDGGILTLFKAINEAMNPIIQLAAGKMQVGKETVSFDDKQCIKAGETIVSVFRALLTPMKEFAGLIEGVEMSTLAEALSMPLPIMKRIADLKPEENNLAVNAEIFGTAVTSIFEKMGEAKMVEFYEATKGIDHKLMENILLMPYNVINKVAKMDTENLAQNIATFNASLIAYFTALRDDNVKMNELYDTHNQIDPSKFEDILLLPYVILKKINEYGPVEKELMSNIVEFTTTLDNYMQSFTNMDASKIDEIGKSIDYDQTLKTMLLPLEMFKAIMEFGPIASQLDQNVNLYCLSLSQVIETAKASVNKFT